jgi:hypothetical protein
MNDEEIQQVFDKQAITEVIYNYCRGLDRMDRELASTVWHGGGTADYGAYMFQGTGEGFLDWVWVQHEGVDRHSHQISNILIEVDGDRAVSEAYVTAALRTRPRDGASFDIVNRGRYVDRWSRREGRWAIDHRRYVEDFTNLTPVADSPMTATTQAASRRDRSDPSYEALGG